MTEVVVDVHGVGFSVSVPISTYEKLPTPGGEVTLYTHLQMREDNLQLFGFATREERSLFRLLTSSVSGVGPKLALNVLSCVTIDGFAAAITNSDIKTLSKINGIGKRTAERMVVELKDKVGSFSGTASSGGGKPGSVLNHGSQEMADAIAALETLGFRNDAALKAVQQICDGSGETAPSAEQLIRKALALLNS